MTTIIVTRNGKGSALTWTEADSNFTNLQATADLALTLATTTFTSSSVGVAPASGGGITNYLRADGTWADPAAGSATDLGYVTATNTITSSTGTDAVLPVFSSTEDGLAPSSGGGTSNYLRADGTWAAPPGTGGTSSVTGVLDAQGIYYSTYPVGTIPTTIGWDDAWSTQGSVSTGTEDTTNFYNDWPHIIATDNGNSFGLYQNTLFYTSSTAGKGGFDFIVVSALGPTFPTSTAAFLGFLDSTGTANPFTADFDMFGLGFAGNSGTASENDNWHTIHHDAGSGVWTKSDLGVARGANQVIWQRFYASPGSNTLTMDAYLVSDYNSVVTLVTGFTGTNPFTTRVGWQICANDFNVAAQGGSVRFYKSHGVIYGMGNPF